MSMYLDIDAAGVAWVTFNDPDAKVNIFNEPVMRELEVVLDKLGARKPKGVIFISGKPDVFIAGADIREIAKVESVERGTELSRVGHRVFGKIEQLGVPTVAAIHGACLGGGCEMVLACSYRIATDHPKTQIGLPETQLGIIPGWGGTQRLPKLIGLNPALGIILPGKTVNADKARRIGLVDEVVPPIALQIGRAHV